MKKLQDSSINGMWHVKHNQTHICRQCLECQFNWLCLCLKWRDFMQKHVQTDEKNSNEMANT